MLDRRLESPPQGDDGLDAEADPLEAGGKRRYLAIDRKHDHVEGDEIKQLVVHGEEDLEMLLASGGESRCWWRSRC